MKPVILVFFISFLSFSLAPGQEKKIEQNVIVIIADKSGTEVVIDTTFISTGDVESVILKDGKVIRINTIDRDNNGGSGKQYKVIAHVDKDVNDTDNQNGYINDDKVIRHSGERIFDINVSNNEFDNEVNKTKFVIAKNGITVSIEGSDEEKVKELAKEIEKKLDPDNEVTTKTSKETEKEIIRKK